MESSPLSTLPPPEEVIAAILCALFLTLAVKALWTNAAISAASAPPPASPTKAAREASLLRSDRAPPSVTTMASPDGSKRARSAEEKMTNSILRKWAKQGGFIRFLDGNTMNSAVTNLTWVTLRDAMENISWTVDWDSELTEEECLLVETPEWRAGLRFSKA